MMVSNAESTWPVNFFSGSVCFSGSELRELIRLSKSIASNSTNERNSRGLFSGDVDCGFDNE